MKVVVLGAGGAARAVVASLAESGASDVVVVARRAEAAEQAAALGGRTGGDDEVPSAEVIVNATPVGMGSDAGSVPLDIGLLRAGQVVVDLVYQPRRTALLAAAAAAGARPVDGLGMLVHQAARAFRLWTGVEAPVPAMREAAEAELQRRS
jgi:shikimate dehydrogenase